MFVLYRVTGCPRREGWLRFTANIEALKSKSWRKQTHPKIHFFTICVYIYTVYNAAQHSQLHRINRFRTHFTITSTFLIWGHSNQLLTLITLFWGSLYIMNIHVWSNMYSTHLGILEVNLNKKNVLSGLLTRNRSYRNASSPYKVPKLEVLRSKKEKFKLSAIFCNWPRLDAWYIYLKPGQE